MHQTAIIWEADETADGRKVTYGQLLREVSALANVLKSLGVKKGDAVAIYLPMSASLRPSCSSCLGCRSTLRLSPARERR